MGIPWATKISTLRTQKCHYDLNLFFCNLQFVQAQKGLQLDPGARSGMYLLIREGYRCECVYVFRGGKEKTQDTSISDSSFLVFLLLPKDQQTAVLEGAVPLRQLGPLTCSGRTALSLEQWGAGGGAGENEKIMNVQIHPDL